MLEGAALFISPHYDDVALSCGGTVARLAGRGHAPAVVTVFASEVLPEMMGDLAARKHERWRIDDPALVAEDRRKEDEAAARILGCSLRWLGLPDAIYRDRYPADADLYGSLHPEEQPLVAHLAAELRALPDWRPCNAIFVPLGAGRHVDHQLCFEVGRLLAQQGERVYAYEDVPYAIHTPQGVAERLAQVSASIDGEELWDVTATLPRRIEAVRQYRSQLPVIFRFTGDFAAAIEAHARAWGGGARERFWRLGR